ncbi:hypothetical protein ACFLW2_01360 [Chloroflexota bacterium]
MLTEINIVAAGIIVGLAVTADIYEFAFLLTMTLFSSCLGLLWIAQNLFIVAILLTSALGVTGWRLYKEMHQGLPTEQSLLDDM